MLRLIWPMDWSSGARRVNHILISFSSCKNELYVLFIFLTAIGMQFLFSDAGILPLQFSYYELTANLMFDIRHRNAPRNIRDLFQDISNIHPYYTRTSASHNFYTQSSRLSIQLNLFSRVGTKIWNEMPLTIRNLSKHDFKRKIKRVLFNILSSEDSYLDIRNVTQKVKFS